MENAIHVARANLDEARAWYAAAHARYVALDRAYHVARANLDDAKAWYAAAHARYRAYTRPDPDESQEAYDDAAADALVEAYAARDDLDDAQEAYDDAVRDFATAVYHAANHRESES